MEKQKDKIVFITIIVFKTINVKNYIVGQYHTAVRLQSKLLLAV